MNEPAKPTRVIHQSDATGAPDEVYIGRGSRWGNPYTHHASASGLTLGSVPITIVASRDDAVEHFRHLLWERLNPPGEPELEQSRIRDVAALRGKTLVCFCKPQRCHGDVLAMAAEWAHKQQPDAMLGRWRNDA